jgi:RHS repeat-associated protein
VTGSTVTKYYYAGAQRVAMRKGSTLSYLLSDHLGSTSLTLDASGNVTSELRYKAWGEVRYAGGITPTDYTFTGQYSNFDDFGLLFYQARWYDPALGRFAQADTIIPEQTQGVQAWDRYAYTNNNPLRFNDPTGHWPEPLSWLPPAGNQIQFNIALGLNVKSLFLIYYSVSLVTDHEGGVQVYFTKRDQEYIEGTEASGGNFDPGPAEEEYPTEMLAFGGASVTYGGIEGSEFSERGTPAYIDQAVNNIVLGVGPVSLDHYATFDQSTGEMSPSQLEGWDIGVGVGGPLTLGSVSTKAIPLTSRIQLPPPLISSCKALGLCGSYPPPFSMIETVRESIKRFREYRAAQ